MTTKKIFLLACLILIIKTSFSQNLSKTLDSYPIDISLKACLDSTENQTTAGMITCVYRACDSWDSEMNKYYKLLLGIISPEAKIKLKASQKKWLEYRDSEFITGHAIYNDMGTMWLVVAVNTQMEIVKQRALDLKSYYFDLTFDK